MDVNENLKNSPEVVMNSSRVSLCVTVNIDIKSLDMYMNAYDYVFQRSHLFQSSTMYRHYKRYHLERELSFIEKRKKYVRDCLDKYGQPYPYISRGRTLPPLPSTRPKSRKTPRTPRPRTSDEKLPPIHGKLAIVTRS